MKLHKDLTGEDLHSPKQHKTSHYATGSDPLEITSMNGIKADTVLALPGDEVYWLRQLGAIISTLESKIEILAAAATITFPDDK